MQVWAPQYEKVIKLSECPVDGDGEGTGGKVCEEQLKSCSLFSPQERRLKGDLTTLQALITLQPLMALQLLITLQPLMALQFSHDSLLFLLGMDLIRGDSSEC